MSPPTVSQLPSNKGFYLEIVHENDIENDFDDIERTLKIINAASRNKWENIEDKELIGNDLSRSAEENKSTFVSQLWDCMQKSRDMFLITYLSLRNSIGTVRKSLQETR